jgi:hypothetical protein
MIPKPALDAIVAPAPFTLVHAALLEKIASPLITANIDEAQAYDLIPSLYLLTLPASEAVKHLSTLNEDAIAWAESRTAQDYKDALASAVQAVAKFYAMLPSPEAGAKKA